MHTYTQSVSTNYKAHIRVGVPIFVRAQVKRKTSEQAESPGVTFIPSIHNCGTSTIYVQKRYFRVRGPI